MILCGNYQVLVKICTWLVTVEQTVGGFNYYVIMNAKHSSLAAAWSCQP